MICLLNDVFLLKFATNLPWPKKTMKPSEILCKGMQQVARLLINRTINLIVEWLVSYLHVGLPFKSKVITR